MFNNSTQSKSITGVNAFLIRTYGLMFLNILVSALASYITLNTMPQLATSSAFGWGMLLFIIIFAFIFGKATFANPTLGFTLMLIYSYLIGMSLSSLFLVYTQRSIAGAFISASAIFAGLAFYGSTTKRNMASWGAYLFAIFIAAFVTEIVNIFLRSSGLQSILSWVFLIIFVIFAAYDSNQLKRMYYQNNSSRSLAALSIFGAFNFYIDFINIFIQLLEISNDNN